MKVMDVLQRLDKACKLIRLMPADTDILSALLDTAGGDKDFSCIQLASGELGRLVEANVLDPENLTPSHGVYFDKLSISTGEFDLFELQKIDGENATEPAEVGQ